MKLVRFHAVAAAAVLLALGTVHGETKDYPKLIVGKWKVAKADPETVPVGAVFEFLADGKLKFRFMADGQELLFDGNYKIQGSKFTITVRFGDEGKSQEVEITKLDQQSLSLIDSDKRAVELNRL